MNKAELSALVLFSTVLTACGGGGVGPTGQLPGTSNGPESNSTKQPDI